MHPTKNISSFKQNLLEQTKLPEFCKAGIRTKHKPVYCTFYGLSSSLQFETKLLEVMSTCKDEVKRDK